MFKHYFELVENIQVGPILALIMFFSFFLGMAVWIYYLDNKFIDKMKNLPLEDGLTKSNKE